MFAAIDKYLVKHAPLWYRTPKVQTAALGLVFFWVFAAYTTVQFYSASIYGSELAADFVSAVYLTFTVTCLFAPGLVNKFGVRVAMFFGVLCYGNLVLASLIYFEYGGENVRWARRLVVCGGAVLGVGASALWTAQGRLILQYAARAEELESNKTQIDSKGSGKGKAGTLMSIFWSIFQCSSLVGGTISFIYYNKKPEGSTSLYILFLGFILIGAIFTQFLLPPSMLQSNHKAKEEKDLEMKSEQTPLNVDVSAQYDRSESQMSENGKSEATLKEDLSTKSWFEEARGTIQIFFTREMMYLSPLFMYTGFNQPYQQATFGNRFFTKRTIGAELIIFHLMEILGAIVIGRFLDSDKSQFDSPRKRAIFCLGLFVVINGTGNAIAFFQEFSAKNSSSIITNDISDLRCIIPSAAFALWGFADAQIQVYCYWLIGSFYKSGHDHSRAVGWYKCVQSLGTAIGFFLIPTQRLDEVTQLSVSSLLFLVGTALSFTQLPSKTVH